jgi:predicted Rossmann-fold nucleotide-binding protein
MDEFFEILTWNQLKIHDKQIIILNTAGFYDHLIKHLDRMKEAEFLHNALTSEVVIVKSPAEISFLQ